MIIRISKLGNILMKRFSLYSALFILTIGNLVNISYAEETFLTPKTIFVAGDSTAATYNKPDHQGWAGVFQSYFNKKKIKVDNRARGGRSTRTFIAEGLWQKLIDDVKTGDIVMIQFGHNDSSPINDDRRARGTIPGIGNESVDIHNMLTKKNETVYTFGHYIRKMVADVKAKGATPILMSLTARKLWHNHRLERGSGQYGYWMYQLAWELDTPFIDVTNPVVDQLEALGAEKTAAMYTKDYVHFNPLGAELHASTIVAAIKGLKPTLANNLYSKKGKKVKSANWTWLRLPIVNDSALKTVFMVGDSTVRNGAGDGANLQWGWGSFIKDFIDDKKVNLVNRAIGGFSSRTFVNGGHWQRTLNMMKPGDYVLIQFGHNDAAPLNDEKRARGTIKGIGFDTEVIDNLVTGKTETVYSYGAYLREMIGEARSVGAIPIICSPVPRKKWEQNSHFILKNKNSYPQWAEQVARQSQSLFIDLNTLIANKYNRLTKEEVTALFADEHTHTSEAGAKMTAEVVATQLQSILAL